MPTLAVQHDRPRKRKPPAPELLPVEWKVAWLDTFAKLQAVERQALGGPELTERELQVAALVAEGHSNHVIGLKLGVTGHTVKFHLDNVMWKLHANNRAQVAAMAVRMGLA